MRVAFIGDSLSQYSTRSNNWITQSCAVIEALLGVEVSYLNVAIAGSTWGLALNSKQHSNGTKSQVERVIEFNPDFIVCALGINDSVYIGGVTESTVLQNCTAMVGSLRASLPNAKLIYAEECPHNILGVGVVPDSLTNINCVPASQATINLKGLSGVRVNSPSFLSSNVSSQTLERHRTWGLSTLEIRDLFDSYFSVNVWKMTRLGCLSDSLHLDEMGQSFWCWQFIKHLAKSNLSTQECDFTNLDFSSLPTPPTDLDLFFNEVSGRTLSGNMPALYKGYNLYKKLAGWCLKSPGARMHTDSILSSGNSSLSVLIEDALPNSSIWIASDSTNFVNTGRLISPCGTHLQTFCPAQVFADFRTSGSKTLWFAAVSPDGGSTDVFSAVINVVANIP